MLHNEERRLIIQALNGHIPVKEIAECFSVNTSTIYRLRKQMEMTGSVETRTSLRGRKPVLSNDDIVHIDNLIQQQPDITINEIMDTLQLKVSDETVRQAVLKLGYVYKKKSLHMYPGSFRHMHSLQKKYNLLPQYWKEQIHHPA